MEKQTLRKIGNIVAPVGSALNQVWKGDTGDLKATKDSVRGIQNKAEHAMGSITSRVGDRAVDNYTNVFTGGTYDIKKVLEGDQTTTEATMGDMMGGDSNTKWSEEWNKKGSGHYYKNLEKGVSGYVHPKTAPVDTSIDDAARLKAQQEQEAQRRMRRMGASLLARGSAGGSNLGVTNG